MDRSAMMVGMNLDVLRRDHRNEELLRERVIVPQQQIPSKASTHELQILQQQLNGVGQTDGDRVQLLQTREIPSAAVHRNSSPRVSTHQHLKMNSLQLSSQVPNSSPAMPQQQSQQSWNKSRESTNQRVHEQMSSRQQFRTSSAVEPADEYKQTMSSYKRNSPTPDGWQSDFGRKSRVHSATPKYNDPHMLEYGDRFTSNNEIGKGSSQVVESSQDLTMEYNFLKQRIAELEDDFARLAAQPSGAMSLLDDPSADYYQSQQSQQRQLDPQILSLPPPSLYVQSEMRSCASGIYSLLESSGGKFVWGCGGRRLYQTKGGPWIIGSLAAMERESGRMISVGGDSNELPHEKTHWKIHTSTGWVSDESASVTVSNRIFPMELRVSGCMNQANGIYNIVEGDVWKGHPVWRSGSNVIYTVEKGSWIIGPISSLGSDAGWTMSSYVHGGILPHNITGWVIIDGNGGWSPTTNIRIDRGDGDATHTGS